MIKKQKLVKILIMKCQKIIVNYYNNDFNKISETVKNVANINKNKIIY